MSLEKRYTLKPYFQWIPIFGILLTLLSADGQTPMSSLTITPHQTELLFDFIQQGENVKRLDYPSPRITGQVTDNCTCFFQRVHWYQWHELVCMQVIAVQEQTYLSICHSLRQLNSRHSYPTCREKHNLA